MNLFFLQATQNDAGVEPVRTYLVYGGMVAFCCGGIVKGNWYGNGDLKIGVRTLCF